MRRAAEQWNSAKSLRAWLAVLGSGLLLGLIICLMELIEQPLAQANLAAVWLFMFIKSGFWLGVGVVWAVFVRLAEPRLSVAALAALSLLMAILVSLALVAPVEMGRLPWFGSGGPANDTTTGAPLDGATVICCGPTPSTEASLLTLFAAVRRILALAPRSGAHATGEGRSGGAAGGEPAGRVPPAAPARRHYRCPGGPEGALPVTTLHAPTISWIFWWASCVRRREAWGTRRPASRPSSTWPDVTSGCGRPWPETPARSWWMRRSRRTLRSRLGC